MSGCCCYRDYPKATVVQTKSISDCEAWYSLGGAFNADDGRRPPRCASLCYTGHRRLFVRIRRIAVIALDARYLGQYRFASVTVSQELGGREAAKFGCRVVSQGGIGWLRTVKFEILSLLR